MEFPKEINNQTWWYIQSMCLSRLYPWIYCLECQTGANTIAPEILGIHILISLPVCPEISVTVYLKEILSDMIYAFA